MAHWDDSGTAVGYEGADGDELIRHSMCGHEWLSSCCTAIEHPTFAGLCFKCKDHNVFECSCGETRLSRND